MRVADRLARILEADPRREWTLRDLAARAYDVAEPRQAQISSTQRALAKMQVTRSPVTYRWSGRTRPMPPAVKRLLDEKFPSYMAELQKRIEDRGLVEGLPRDESLIRRTVSDMYGELRGEPVGVLGFIIYDITSPRGERALMTYLKTL